MRVAENHLFDRLNRSLRDLRISVTDRCNFRCSYCMPLGSMKGRGSFLPLERLLTDHEIVNVVQAFAGLGVRKIRLTGGDQVVPGETNVLIQDTSWLTTTGAAGNSQRSRMPSPGP